MLFPKSRRRKPRLLFEEATEIGRIFKAQVVSDFLGLFIREEEEALSFEHQSFLDDLLGRLLFIGCKQIG